MSGQKLAFNTTRLYSAAASIIAVLAFGCATRAMGQDDERLCVQANARY